MFKQLTAVILLVLGAGVISLSAAGPESKEAIAKSMQLIMPGVKPDQIVASPIDGVSEVLVGPRLFYVTNDGRYLFQGSLIDLKTRKDISEDRRKTIRLAAVEEVGEDNMIIFPAAKPRHTITVFTDIDCGYCRKLHNEVDKYNEAGITVRYLLFPRAGLKSASYDKAVSVWCNKDKQDALTRSKAGESLTKVECDNPVKDHMDLGKVIGVRGTPALVLDDGELMPGYVPAARLSKALDSKQGS